MSYRIAILQLPGVNCEPETRRALEQAGLEAEIVRWTRSDIDGFDGFVIPGGFAFQDRVRAGSVAAREPIVEAVITAARDGKPVIGICNGAQVLVESGLVPGLAAGRVEMALAPNRMIGRRGYYCQWTHVRVEQAGTAATLEMPAGTIAPLPIAHAEGRFVTRDPQVEAALADGNQIVLRYCRHDGAAAAGFPDNPNGSLLDAAGISNPAGNVVAMMPHPERATLLHQVAWELDGPWGERRRTTRDHGRLVGPGPGLAVFSSMRRYLEGAAERLTGSSGASATTSRPPKASAQESRHA